MQITPPVAYLKTLLDIVLNTSGAHQPRQDNVSLALQDISSALILSFIIHVVAVNKVAVRFCRIVVVSILSKLLSFFGVKRKIRGTDKQTYYRTFTLLEKHIAAQQLVCFVI